MQKLFDEVNSLDRRCYEEFLLSEDILMEHASNSMALYINQNLSHKKSILIVCGSGNNGADGLALSRLLHKKYEIKIYLISDCKSSMSKLQYDRVKTLGIEFVDELYDADIVVDSIFGTGLNKSLDENTKNIIYQLNSLNGFKIACDIPSGINQFGQISDIAFKADITLTMGALKTSLFSDIAKDYTGEIIVCDLGVQRVVYETNSNKYLLEKSDMNLPFRDKKNSHKGSFGHVNVVAGTKKGASIICAEAGFTFGAGLVTVVTHEELNLPQHIMQNHFISENCTAIAIGMGLGIFENEEIKKILQKDISLVVDADLFYSKLILEVLEKEVVLTPHPKEFCSLLKLSDIADITIEELQNNRLLYVEKFCKKYSKPVLLLKGANVIIAQNDRIFINSFGTQALSKGGSGDVLSGLIGSLLAQRYEILDATITASLAHSFSARLYDKNNYSLMPQDIIDGIKRL